MEAVIVLVYMVAGYWAVGRTIWRDKVILYTNWSAMVCKRWALGTFLGWLLIPWAIIKR